MNYLRKCLISLLKEKKLSQKEVAISLSCTESQLSKFLNKQKPFPKKKIHKIFEVCEIDIGEEKENIKEKMRRR